MRKQRKIVIEVGRVRTVSLQSQIYATKCAGCGGAEVELVTFAEAARIVATSVDKIITYAARGEAHLGLRPEALLVCLNSLLNIAEFSGSVKAH